MARMVLQDEAGVKLAVEHKEQAVLKRCRTAIAEGQWEEVAQLSKVVLKAAPGHEDSEYVAGVRRAFLYSVYRQQFLEHIERRETQQVRLRLTSFFSCVSVCEFEGMSVCCVY